MSPSTPLRTSSIRLPLGELSAHGDGALRRYRAGFRSVWVWRSGDRVRGYYDFCTHQGGALQQQGEAMVCSRHHATFDAVSGQRIAGEAPEGSVLPPAELAVEEGKIVLFLPNNDV